MKKIILAGIGGLFLALPIADNVYAVWPPSTSFGQKAPDFLYGYILIAFIIGVAVGIWAKGNRDEHK
jgi:hypothetical protein